MTNFLVVHKVDGKPAYDIATRLEHGTATDPGPWWILIDGHRAYPYFAISLRDLQVKGVPFLDAVPTMPTGHRDFYVLTRAEKPELMS